MRIRITIRDLQDNQNLFCYHEFMKKSPETIIAEILSPDPSVERVRTAFRNFGDKILKAQEVTKEKRKNFERDFSNGARATKHRFNP